MHPTGVHLSVGQQSHPSLATFERSSWILNVGARDRLRLDHNRVHDMASWSVVPTGTGDILRL